MLTFAFDVQLNDKEDWIAAGTKVKMSTNKYYLNRFNDSTPVIIDNAYSYDGKRLKIQPIVEWFSNKSFVELN